MCNDLQLFFIIALFHSRMKHLENQDFYKKKEGYVSLHNPPLSFFKKGESQTHHAVSYLDPLSHPDLTCEEALVCQQL